MTNIIKTRIKNKIKKLEEWKLSNPVLLNGEIAIVIDGNLTRIKTGNGISAFNDLPYVSNTQHITYENYAQLLKNGNIDPQMVYILSNDYVDCFGEQIKNLAPGTDLSDAVNVEQLNDAISSINIPEIPTKISEFENDAKYANISVDGEITTDFKVEHITQDDYHNLVTSENGIDSKTLYIVSSDTLNMYGEKIINVLSGENDNDATNVSQVKSYVNELKIDLDENINIVNELLEKKIYIDGQYSDLSILRIDADTYHNLVSNNQVNKDILYIISSDNTNAYGERIENVATPLSASDAVNKEYADTLSINLTEKIDNIEIPKNLSEFENDLNLSKVLVDGENIEEFNVKHISQEEYHELVLSENGIDKDTLYVVSSDTLNAYGEQIKNVAPGVENTDAVNVEQLSAVEQKIEKLNQLHDFQVIRPDFDQSINIRMYIYSNQEMDTPILSVDSGVVPEYFAAFFNNSEITYWIAPSENGFTAEFSNRPVLVKLSNIIKDHELEYSRLFITYEWYYKTDDDIHISDKYSIVVPSYTEVGANASDYVSKKQFEELKQDFRKESAQSQLQEDDMFVCYSNKTNILSGYQNGEVDLILDDFDKSNQYDIKFKTGTQPVKFKFHYEDFNGIQFGEWNINSGYEFPENSDYMIKIRQDMMEVVDGQYPLKEYGYKLVVGELTGNNKKLSCQIENRTITTLNLDSSDLSVTIKLPEKKYSGYARDFILRMNVTELPCIIWDGIDDNWEASDNDWMNLEVGQNVISFTEMG